MSTAPRLAAAKRDWGHDETGCTVLHIDMDAFYASLETARNPSLAGRPVIIGGSGPRSVVSAANYEARAYGVNSAMPMARARQLCPDGQYVSVDMAYYRRMSRCIFTQVFSQVTDRIEQVSVDEGYMDVSAALLRWGSPSAIGAWIRAEVQRRFHITCSVGIASNKLVAKMASTNAKPDGMLLIPLSQQAAFVQMMPLRGIPGIGPSLERKLEAWGITSVADLADTSEEALAQATHSKILAHNLHLASHGLDERPIVTDAPEKSIGAEVTFEEDTRSMVQVAALLHHCCNEVSASLRKKGLVARTVTVKLRFANLSYSTKAHTLERPVDTTDAMYPESLRLLRSMLGMGSSLTDDALLPREVRLAGVSASTLSAKDTTPVQLSIEDLLGQGQNQRTRPIGNGGKVYGTNEGNRDGNSDLQSGQDNDHSVRTGQAAAKNQNNPLAATLRTRNATISQSDRMHDAEAAIDAVHAKYGKQAASLGLEHGVWRNPTGLTAPKS
ncbi:DNA polymerase IV [Bifidobacterium bombi]|uniref:DNA polymerase IV n=1 Tax=Bifidobacterium bombi DSM 19703 TaxID=1341695 RepID=A0A086BNT8_9BIFI|nr:DNA polymerase IV [Bifidobacterium bombi]KFF30602.1 DNA-directed DNA polymerase IV [Bifidobacterium bombi DSM 19703]